MSLSLTNREKLFLAGTAIVVVSAVVYFKLHHTTQNCRQGFNGFNGSSDFFYNPNVTNLGSKFPYSAQGIPIGMEYMTTPPLYAKGMNIPYQQSMIQNHPMTLSRQQLEDMVAVDSLSMGPGMVEGYRFRGNLNL
jgi:hypothetical protein